MWKRQLHILIVSSVLLSVVQPVQAEESPLPPLNKGGTNSEVPLVKGTLGGSKGYAERVLLNGSKAALDSSRLTHLRQLNVFNIDYFADWYFNHFSLYPQIQHYVEQLDHLRLLLIEHLNQRSLSMTA